MRSFLKYDKGEIVSITSSRSAGYGYDHRMEVTGEFGLLKLDNLSENNITFYNKNNIENGKVMENFPERF